MYLESKEGLKFAYNRSLKYFTVLGVFIGVATVLFSREVNVFNILKPQYIAKYNSVLKLI